MDEHLTVDGTLIESPATLNGMRRRDGRDEPPVTSREHTVDFHGDRPTNETHVASPDAAADLLYVEQVLMEHRTGLPIDVETTEANGCAERDATLTMLDRLPKRGCRTLQADKAYDTAEFVAALRKRGVTPHVAASEGSRGGPRQPKMKSLALSAALVMSISFSTAC